MTSNSIRSYLFDQFYPFGVRSGVELVCVSLSTFGHTWAVSGVSMAADTDHLRKGHVWSRGNYQVIYP